MKYKILYLLVFILLMFSAKSYALPIVPNSEGHGMDECTGGSGATRGSGSTILRVTNLNDSGAGSFRAAVTAPDARTVIFEVSGFIDLTSSIRISNPYLTIAGQTAPGPVVIRKGTNFGGGYMFQIATDDVLVQHIAFRHGGIGNQPGEGDNQDNVHIAAGSSDIVFDHVSLSWGTDGTFDVAGTGISNVTIKNCIMNETLLDHSFCQTLNKAPNGVTVYGNLYAHHRERCPTVNGGNIEIINNLVYNYGNTGTIIKSADGAANVSIINNVYKTGLSTGAGKQPISLQGDPSPVATTYISGNMLDGSIAANQYGNPLTTGAGSVTQSGTRLSSSGLTPKATADVQAWVLANAGARPLDRDSVDTRIVSQVTAGTGQIITSITEVGGWGTINSQVRTLTVPANKDVVQASGYTALEEWLHTFSAALETEGAEEPSAVKYVSPTGNNNNTGSQASPWLTLTYASANMQGGGTLIIEDGTYTNVSGENILSPPSGTAMGYTTIKAADDFQVTIDGNGLTWTPPINIVGKSYIKIEGLKIANSTSYESGAYIDQSNHIKLMRMSFHNAVGGSTLAKYGSPIRIRDSTYCLVEDVWICGRMRYGIIVRQENGTCQYIILRRCVVRWDMMDTDQPIAGIAVYGTDVGDTIDHVQMQNCIVLDWNPNDYGTKNSIYGAYYCPHVTHHIKWFDCIALNIHGTNTPPNVNYDQVFAGYYIADDKALNLDRSMYNCVSWDTHGSGVWIERGDSMTTTLDQLTIGDSDGNHRDINASMYDKSLGTSNLTNSMMVNNAYANSGIDTSDYNHYWPAGQVQGTNALSTNPNLKFIVRTTDTGTGSGGKKRGATIEKRYGVSGTLWGETGWNQRTNVNLWPWPYEAQIKADFGQANAHPGGTTIPDAHDPTRGFCASGNGLYGGVITLTSYIWEYLGYATPPEIYGTDPIPGEGEGDISNPSDIIDVRVSQSSDDAEERKDTGAIDDLASTDLEFTNAPEHGDQWVGMRFQGITVPKSSTISSAYIEVEVDEISAVGTDTAYLYGEDIDNAPTFGTDTNNISSRTRTTASVTWNMTQWDTVDQKKRTPSIVSIIQEIVNRAGWASGNSIVIVADGDVGARRTAESYDGEPTNAPLLHIEWTPPSAGATSNRKQPARMKEDSLRGAMR